jgi:hypothetical protein
MAEMPPIETAEWDLVSGAAVEYLLGSVAIDPQQSMDALDALWGRVGGEEMGEAGIAVTTQAAMCAMVGLFAAELVRMLLEAEDDPDVTAAGIIATAARRAGPRNAASDNRVCRVCGCTALNACRPAAGAVGGHDRPCHWVEVDLCSACQAVVPDAD